MSKSQDYITKVRYQNDLPPPLLPPKLLKYDGKKEEEARSSSLLSSLFRKENVKNLIPLDNDFGLAIDAINIPELINGDIKTGSEAKANAKLHPADRVLLRDPQVEKSFKDQPAVSFLRRTEYLGTNKSNSSSSAHTARAQTPSLGTDDDSPASHLRSIEATFESSTKTLHDTSKLRHPLKKSLRAKKVWSLLPDISRMDQKFDVIRIASNSIQDVTDLKYRTAVYRKMRLAEVDWISFYTTDDDSAKTVKRTLDDLNENIPKEVTEGGERYKFIKRSDYDLTTTHLLDGLQEIALQFDQDNGIVYYNPISDKSELKRRKIQESHRELLEATDLDEIDLRIREPTVDELNKRNTLRNKHDSVTYEASEFKDNSEEPDDLDDLRQNRGSSQ